MGSVHVFQLSSKTQLLWLTYTSSYQCFKSTNHLSPANPASAHHLGWWHHYPLFGLCELCRSPHNTPEDPVAMLGSAPMAGPFHYSHGWQVCQPPRGLHTPGVHCCPDAGYLTSTFPTSPRFSHCYHTARATTPPSLQSVTSPVPLTLSLTLPLFISQSWDWAAVVCFGFIKSWVINCSSWVSIVLRRQLLERRVCFTL